MELCVQIEEMVYDMAFVQYMEDKLCEENLYLMEHLSQFLQGHVQYEFLERTYGNRVLMRDYNLSSVTATLFINARDKATYTQFAVAACRELLPMIQPRYREFRKRYLQAALDRFQESLEQLVRLLKPYCRWYRSSRMISLDGYFLTYAHTADHYGTILHDANVLPIDIRLRGFLEAMDATHLCTHPKRLCKLVRAQLREL